MHDISPRTAAQRVVYIPELVDEILSWLVVKNPKQYQGKGAGNVLIFADLPTLARCGRINRVWFKEAMPILWRQASKLCKFSLPQKFAHIKPCRRQFYANFITTGNLVDSKRENVRSSTRALHRVIFPRLRCLKLIVDCRQLKFCMPRLRAPGLELIEIHAAFIRRASFREEYGVTFVCKSEWSISQKMISISGQLKRQFGRLERVVFGPQAKLTPKTLQKFRERLPDVRVAVLDDYDEDLSDV